jgi:hypothetical protein
VKAYGAALKVTSEPGAVCRCHTNRAQAYLQLREYESVIKECSDAIAIDSTNVKALVRRATALAAIEQCERASADLDHALTLQPPPTLIRAINSIREQVRSIQKLAMLPENLVGDTQAAIGLVHEEQTLRLFFKLKPPKTVPLGRWFPISVYLANEFGLWRRSDYPGEGLLQLRCVILPQPYCSEGDDRPEEEVGVDVGDAATSAVFHPGSSCRASFKVRFRQRKPDQRYVPTVFRPMYDGITTDHRLEVIRAADEPLCAVQPSCA